MSCLTRNEGLRITEEKVSIDKKVALTNQMLSMLLTPSESTVSCKYFPDNESLILRWVWEKGGRDLRVKFSHQVTETMQNFLDKIDAFLFEVISNVCERIGENNGD